MTVRGALLIDLDGVMRTWPLVDTGLPSGTVEAVAFDPDLAGLVLTGRIADEQWRDEIQDRLAREHGRERARQAVAAWSQYGTVDGDVLRLVRSVRRSAPVWLASNATSRLPVDLAVLGLDSELDGVVNSSQIGAAKPDAEFFRAALAVVGPVALFVDDSPGHVEAARQLGLSAHLFKDSATLDAALRGAGLLGR